MNARGKEAAALALHRFGFGPAAQFDFRHCRRSARRACSRTSIARPRVIGGEAAVERAQPRGRFPTSAPRSRRSRSSHSAPRRQSRGEPGMAAQPRLCRCAPSRTPNRKPHQPPLPQQIFQNEATARFEAAVGADIGFVERLVWFWSNHFCISADKDRRDGRRLRARGDPRPCARPLRRHAAGGRKPSGDAVLSRQCPVDGRQFDRRHQPRQGAERKSRARDSRAAHARCPQRLYAGRRHELCQCAHRLDLDPTG